MGDISLMQGGSGPRSTKHKGCKVCFVPCPDCLKDNQEPEGEYDAFGPLKSKTVDKRRQSEEEFAAELAKADFPDFVDC